MSDTLIKDRSPAGQNVAPEAGAPPTVAAVAQPVFEPIRIGPNGHVVLPADAPRRLGLGEGDELCVLVEDDMIKLMTRERLISLIQDAFDEYEGSLVEELLAERRREREIRKRAREEGL